MSEEHRGEVLVLNLVDYPGNPEKNDYAGRLVNGWAPWMDDELVLTLNRWDRRFNAERALKCEHVLFTYEGTVKVVAHITGIFGPYPITRDDGREQSRCAVYGEVLTEGDPAYDYWHGRSDLPGTGNRIEYNYIPAVDYS